DDQRAVLSRTEQLVSGAKSPGIRLIGHFALGTIRVGAAQDLTDLLEADALVVERIEVELDANTGQRAAADGHLAYALNLGEFLRQDRAGGVIDQPSTQHVGSQREN